MSVRAALGASRGRITGQLLTEGLLLSAVAGALGLAFAWWAAPALLALSPAAAGWRTVQLDTTVVLVTAAISLGTGVLFGLVPLLTVRGTNLTPQLRDDGTRTTQSARTTWLRRVLVTAEVALAVVLLVSAGLLVRTFDNLRSVDLGFEPHGLLTAQMSLSEPRFRDAETTARLFQSGLDRITRLPRVEAAAVVSGLPVERGLNVVVDIADAPEPIDNALTDLRYASSGYFAVMRIPVLAGRVFDDRDAAGAPSVAIVNREFARRLMPDGSPLGRHVQVFSQGTLYEIVGVVDNVQEQGLGGDAVPVVYLTVEQVDVSVLATAHYFFQTSWVVRTRTTAPGLAEQIRDEIRAIDPRQPFSGFRPMNAVVDEALLAPRFHMVIMAIFSRLALVLAVAGIYGVMTYSVTARMRDIGIRMAIGASRHRVVGSVLGQAAVLAAVGIALGLAGAVFLTRMLETFVFGVSTSDMKTFVAVAGSLLIVAVLASAIPALRAATVDPVQTLRAE
jgi:putative ABC transport system permease protein